VKDNFIYFSSNVEKKLKGTERKFVFH
jgi:hypothetical protein